MDQFVSQSKTLKRVLWAIGSQVPLFRWFKFTLKPPYMANYDWPFGTLLFGLFGSNLDTSEFETYPRTYSGHF